MSRPLGIGALHLGDDAESWARAGFAMDGRSTTVATTRFHLHGDDRTPSWGLTADGPLPDDVDGIATTVESAPDDPGPTHRNRVTSIDHIVLRSPDLDRTTEAFETLGIDCRRVRDVGTADRPFQQRFFRIGPVILELVGVPDTSGPGPATIWGLALNVDDLDAAVDELGDACGTAKDAVQPGRRIATVKTRDLGISLPIALMTPDPRHR